MKLGIDMGGTTIGLGLTDGGVVLKRNVHPSFKAESSFDETMEYLESLIDGMISADVESIGLGVPSVVDSEKGIVYDTVNIKSWKEVHLKSILEERYGIPVKVNNDANCYAMGAWRKLQKEEGLEDDVLVGVTLGTGVGIGIVLDGKIFNGVNTGAGELSCVPYLDSCLEDYCSSKFFIKYGKEARELYQDAKNGDETALKAFEEFGGHLGYMIALVMYAYDPSTIVLGGGISNCYDMFEKAMTDYLKSHFVYGNSLKRLKIKVMSDPEIPLSGASSL